MAPDGEWSPRFVGHEYPQQIPRPDHVAVGADAPWSKLSEADRRGIPIATIRARLAESGRRIGANGTPSELATVADADPVPITWRSAVLVALFEEAGSTHLVLTRRSRDLRSHSGEVALPGGKSDAGETPVDTALREAREEVGIQPGAVQCEGWLSPLATFASSSVIWPIVGTLHERPEFVVDPREVERAFTVSLDDLLADGAFLEERWRRDGSPFRVDDEGYFPIHFYAVPGDLIWGATARIITELLCVATAVQWPDAERGQS